MSLSFHPEKSLDVVLVALNNVLLKAKLSCLFYGISNNYDIGQQVTLDKSRK